MSIKTFKSSNRDKLRMLLMFCFFFSGVSSLIYEILWMRLISRVIGGAPFEVASILVIFMGGMGIGSYISGKKADRLSNEKLVRYYGILELVIGAYACFAPVLFIALKMPVAHIYNTFFEHTIIYNAIIFVLSFVVLFLPVACMGATLPVLCRFYVKALSTIGSSTGRLYGLNTLGGAVGSLLCGFFLIQHLGVWGTMFSAFVINLIIGTFCIITSYRYNITDFVGEESSGSSVSAVKATKSVKKTAGAETVNNGGEVTAAIIIFMVSGFCAMACEVFWTKLLGLIIGPTTYSFTIVLVTFIIGLAAGNFIFGYIADKSLDLMKLLIVTQIAAAFSGLAVSHMLGNSQLFYAKLIYSFQDSFIVLNLLKGVSLFIIMLLPTIFFGAAFPVVVRISTGSLSVIGDSVGRAYSFNTLGAVLGSFTAGFVLIPLIGKESGLKLVFLTQILVMSLSGIVLLYRRREPLPAMVYPAAAVIAGVIICLNFPSWNRETLSVGKYHRFRDMGYIEEIIVETGWLESLFRGSDILSKAEGGELVYYGDGIGGFTSVLKYPMPLGGYEFSMANSGKMDASSHGDMKTQTLLAHFPMIFSETPRNVMVLGLASGITAGEVLNYPVTGIDIVEINNRVFSGSGFFKPWNNDILSSPKSRLIVQDGIAHLSLTGKKYDVIISEPSNPWMAGMASLFTKDFFTLARERLSEKGLYVQWFHCYQMDWETFALIGRTFAEVFPEGILVTAEPSKTGRDYIFIGSKNGNPLNFQTAAMNIKFAKKSKNIKIESPEIFYRLVVSENLSSLFGKGPLNEDNHPILEYTAPRLMYQAENAREDIAVRINSRYAVSEETKKISEKSGKNITAQIDYAQFALSVNAPFSNMVDLTRASSFERKRYISMLKGYCRRYAMNFDLIDDINLKKELRLMQISLLEDGVAMSKPRSLPYKYLSQLYLQDGMRRKAVDSYLKAVEIEPDDARVHNDLGFIYYELGDNDNAAVHYRKALSIRPRFLLALGNMAYMNLGIGNHAEAVKYFKEIIKLKPDLAESYYNIGFIYFNDKAYHEAINYLNSAIRYKPDMAEALNSLAWIHSTVPEASIYNPKLAVRYALQASRLTGNSNPLHLAALAVSLNSAGRKNDSYNVARRALEIAKKTGRNDIIDLIRKTIPGI